MPNPLPIELRTRAVNAYNDGEGTVEEIAQRFSICSRSLFRWLALERGEHDLSAKDFRHGPAPKIPPDRFTELHELCSQKTDRTVEELARAWSEKNGSISRSAMGRALLHAKLTFKKRLFKHQNVIEKMS
jgi:transposase